MIAAAKMARQAVQGRMATGPVLYGIKRIIEYRRQSLRD
jgi:hypothetical protein